MSKLADEILTLIEGELEAYKNSIQEGVNSENSQAVTDESAPSQIHINAFQKILQHYKELKVELAKVLTKKEIDEIEQLIIYRVSRNTISTLNQFPNSHQKEVCKSLYYLNHANTFFRLANTLDRFSRKVGGGELAVLSFVVLPFMVFIFLPGLGQIIGLAALALFALSLIPSLIKIVAKVFDKVAYSLSKKYNEHYLDVSNDQISEDSETHSKYKNRFFSVSKSVVSLSVSEDQSPYKKQVEDYKTLVKKRNEHRGPVETTTRFTYDTPESPIGRAWWTGRW